MVPKLFADLGTCTACLIFIFMQLSTKILPNNRLPPRSHLGNPGSANYRTTEVLVYTLFLKSGFEIALARRLTYIDVKGKHYFITAIFIKYIIYITLTFSYQNRTEIISLISFDYLQHQNQNVCMATSWVGMSLLERK